MRNRTKPAVALAAFGAAWLAAAGAHAATCGERLGALEAELDEVAELAISASTGGQAVAGAREAQAVAGAEGEVEEPVVPFQEEDEEAEAVERADDAGEGGELVMQARARLEEARVAADGGDEAACEQAYEFGGRASRRHRAMSSRPAD